MTDAQCVALLSCMIRQRSMIDATTDAIDVEDAVRYARDYLDEAKKQTDNPFIQWLRRRASNA